MSVRVKEIDQRMARILILEDDETLCDVLQEVLEARGLQVAVASNGEAALELARSQPFDLIVADIRMKGINGLDTIEQARLLQPDLASIVISGYATEQETLRAVQLNVAGYLKKPFKIPKLIELVNKILAQRRRDLQAEEEVRLLRKSLLWSFRENTRWAEKASPGEVDRPARLAYELARLKELGPGLCEQVYLGMALRVSLGEQAKILPEFLLQALSPFEVLRSTLLGDPLSDFTQTLSHLSGGEQLPAPAELSAQVDPSLKELYLKYLHENNQQPEPKIKPMDEDVVESPQSFSLAINLEQSGDLDGAGRVYDQIVEGEEISSSLVKAHLAKVRLAAYSGNTKSLEENVKKALNVASTMGPSTLAEVEWKAAKHLRFAGHPVAQKLFSRSARSFSKLGQRVPWACCVLSLALVDGALEEGQLEEALTTLAEPGLTSELAELMGDLLPDLFVCASRAEQPLAHQLCERFVRGFYHELGSVLLEDRLPLAARRLALDLVEKSELGLTENLVRALANSDDPEMASKATKLGSQSGTITPLVRARSFGGFTVTVGKQQLTEKDWKTQKTKYLFARLLETYPNPIQVESLMEDFWPNKRQAARNSLNTCVSTLRKLFKGCIAGGEDAVSRVGDTLAINPNMQLWSDEHSLSNALKEAESQWNEGNIEAAILAYTRVMRLYDGPFLDGCYLEWALVRRSYFERQIELALLRLMERRFEQHRYQESLEYARVLISHLGDDRRAHEIAMLSLLGLDRHQAAIEHYEEFKRNLHSQYGSEPSLELMKIYQMAKYGFRQESGLGQI